MSVGALKSSLAGSSDFERRTGVVLDEGIELLGSESSTSLTVVNTDPENPRVVEMSDSLGYLDMTTAGTAIYSIPADDSIEIPIRRSGSVPTSGGPWTTNVFARLSSGAIVSVSVVINALEKVIPLLQGISGAVYIHGFSSASPDTDTKGWGDLVGGGATYEEPGEGETHFDGIFTIDAIADDAYINDVVNNDMIRKSDQDRSIVICLQLNDPGSGERQLFGCVDSANRCLVGWARNTGVSNFVRAQSNGYYDGSSNGSLTDINPGGGDEDAWAILLVSWDAGENETTVSWIATGDGDWQSNVEAGWTSQSDSASTDDYYLGGHQSKAHASRWGAFAVFDAALTTADLDPIAAIMGLGS